MLLIGSRAIRHHLPDFRRPRDWDLVGTQADIDELATSLPRERDPSPSGKAFFRLGSNVVEVGNGTRSSYWGMVLDQFRQGPIVHQPELGELVVAPLGYLLLTKQCGLVYRIGHWHKNLEDLCFMKDRIASIPREIAALVPHCLEDSRRMFAAAHERSDDPPLYCHPAVDPPLEPELHHELHRRLALGECPAVSSPIAWHGYPDVPPAARRQRMVDLFAEETMVVAALRRLTPIGKVAPDAGDPSRCLRWALRTMITGKLPVDWRYFGVNHYQEICQRVPPDWARSIDDLATRAGALEPCGELG